MIRYPSTLPCPTVKAGMAGGPTFVRAEFDFDIRQRAIPSSTYTYEVVFMMKTREQMKEFKDFYHKELFSGVEVFIADWEIEGSLSDKKFRFAATYKTTPLGSGLYSVGASFDMITNIKDI